jgi:outer membrane lipoprotein carrier protein
MLLRAALLLLSVSSVDGGVGHADAGQPAVSEARIGQGPTDGGAPELKRPEPASTPAAPLTAEVKDLVDRMQAFYEKTSDFTAGFQQTYFYKTFKRTQVSSGKVTYRKPALMRWEYEKPSPRTFVLAADKVYAHDPEAKLLTVASIATNQLSASVTFLWGQGKLAQEFSIVKKACPSCVGVLLEMTPLKPDPRFQRVELEVDPKTAQVLKSTVVDPDGSTNTIAFLGLTTNVGVDEKSFRLTPPPGTQVQNFTQTPMTPTPAGAGAPAPHPAP